ncbi:MAG: vWA domain-containing protein [Gemmatimonadales bacterium]
MSVDLPFLLAAAPLVGLLVFFLARRARGARQRALQAWAPGRVAERSAGERAGPLLLAGAALMATVGAAGPRWGSSEIEVETRALNLAIGIDISRSMLAEDVSPSRLGRAIGEARRLVQDARGDRLALLAFAGRSYILTPLTVDDGAVALQLDALDPEIASEGGTDLSAVLAQGRSLLEASTEGGARVLVIFTDGETHDSVQAAVRAAAALRESRITLVLVAEGDTVPARIPVRDERGAVTGWQTDADGLLVRTMRRDVVLRMVADAAGGVLIGSEIADQEGEIWQLVAGLERRAAESRRRNDLVPRGWIFALAAIAVLAVQALPRRSASLVALALALGAGTLPAQRPVSGQRLLARGDTAAAAVAFVRAGARSRSPDSALFNAGTVALAAGDHKAARDLLGAASRSLDPELRFRALFNLGLSDLLESRRDTAKRIALEDEAARSFREALLLEPSSRETKWNLELAQRRTPPPSGGGGGGGTPPPPRNPEQPQPRPSAGALSQSEAEQILNSVERAERAVRGELSRRRRYAQSSAGRDW